LESQIYKSNWLIYAHKYFLLMKFFQSAFFHKISFVFFGGMILMACNTNKVPDSVIPKDKMVNVLVDMHTADAVLSKVRNQDTMLMMASSKYYYIFKKYSIDSAKFTNSLKYYYFEPNGLNEMYKQVLDTLTAKIPEEKIIKKKKLIVKH